MAAQPLPEGWVVSLELRLQGRLPLTEGRKFRVTGETGEFIFLRHVTTAKGEEWIDCYGGRSTKRGDHKQFRSFHPDRVRSVARER